jgi:hypothetical protein
MRERVCDYARQGIWQHRIAKIMRVCEATLKRHCAEELFLGHAEHRARVTLVAYEMAVSGRHPTMTRWWLQRFAGWGVPRRPPGGSIEIEVLPGDDTI